jgi:hypothetical protein
MLHPRSVEMDFEQRMRPVTMVIMLGTMDVEQTAKLKMAGLAQTFSILSLLAPKLAETVGGSGETPVMTGTKFLETGARSNA